MLQEMQQVVILTMKIFFFLHDSQIYLSLLMRMVYFKAVKDTIDGGAAYDMETV